LEAEHVTLLVGIERFFRRDLWEADLATLPAPSRLGFKLLRLAVVAILEFRESALSARATALVYTTLLSLVPLLAVMFSVLKAFGVHQQIEPFLAEIVEPLGPQGAEITKRVIGFVNNMKVGVLGAVGLAGLFYTAFSLIDKIEEALNAIWGVRHPRPLLRKFTDYLSVLLVGPVMVFTAIALIASVQSNWLVQLVLKVEPLGHMMLMVAKLMPFVILCGVFTFLYKFVPHTRVRLTSALAGGMTAGILWDLAGMAFAAFVVGSARYGAVYASFAILILFLIWLYVTWLIVLAGAQVAYFHQHPSAYLTRVRWRRGTHVFREWLALTALYHVTRRHLDGQRPYRPDDLATLLQVPLSSLEGLLDELVLQGFLCRTAQPEGVTLARSPESISLVEILDVISNQDRIAPWSSETDRVGNVLRRRDRAVHVALGGLTLRSLAAENGAPAPDADVRIPQFEERTS
jgi:membrane protein